MTFSRMSENKTPFEIYIIDTETTGLDPVANDIIEVSFWRLKDDEQKTWYLKALNPEAIQDKAMKVNKHLKEDVLHKTAEGKEKYKEPSDVVSEIDVWLMGDGSTAEDRVFVGQNPEFDVEFMKELWKKAGTPDSFPFGNFVVDTMTLVRFVDLCVGRKRARYNLGSLVKDFKITKGKAHQASEDVRMTKDLLLKILDPLKDYVTDVFKNCYSE